MKIVLVHADFIEYQITSPAIKNPEEVDEGLNRIEECLVVFTAVENTEEKSWNEAAKIGVKEILAVAAQVKCYNFILYPWVHLTNTPSSLDIGLKTMKKMEELLTESEENEVHRAPFGWYKGFNLKSKGHPLSELSRKITAEGAEVGDQELISKAITAEDETKHEFFVMGINGEMTPVEDYKYPKNEANLKDFINYEVSIRIASDEAPPHSELMKRLELVDYEPASDPGNFRWYPNGWLVKNLLEDQVVNTMLNYDAMPVETPIMYSYTHPALESYLNRFPARQYTVLSGDNKFFLRFAACFGQFLIASDTTLSHRHLPLKMFELTRYSFRREQSGEISALRRLRAFTMPDMHTLAQDLEVARTCFYEQYKLSMEILDGIEVPYEAVFRFQSDFFEENKEWVQGMIADLGKPSLIELFDKRYAYFICKFEFNYVDSQKKAAALSTVQIDVENAERFDISFINEKDEHVRPYILHTSLSGAIEREVYAVLEEAHRNSQKGVKPSLPLWLAPTQVRMIPVTEEFIPLCEKLASEWEEDKIRVDIDERNESVGKRIREAERMWIPYILVIGEREAENHLWSVRIRGQKEQEKWSTEELISKIRNKTTGKAFRPLSVPKKVSKRVVFYHHG